MNENVIRRSTQRKSYFTILIHLKMKQKITNLQAFKFIKGYTQNDKIELEFLFPYKLTRALQQIFFKYFADFYEETASSFSLNYCEKFFVHQNYK